MKAARAGARRSRSALYELLARAVPEHVLAPIAADASRGWMLLPDGGPSLGERARAAASWRRSWWRRSAQYGRLQRALAPHVDELLALGVPTCGRR